MSNTISAADNPGMVNNLVEKALSEKPTFVEPKITPPSENTVRLPGGLLLPTGELLRTAEVRELNGRDEEAIGKSQSIGKAIMTLVDRCTVKIGDTPVDEKMLYNLLLGDRDALLVGIYKATFGPTAEIPAYCAGCDEYKDAIINVDEDINTVSLDDPINEMVFTVESKKGDIIVRLPNGYVQKELLENSEKSAAELSTIVLERCVITIDESPVVSKSQVQNLSLVDRRKILKEIDDRSPGPKLQEITIICPDCGGKVGVPISFGTLFRF